MSQLLLKLHLFKCNIEISIILIVRDQFKSILRSKSDTSLSPEFEKLYEG